VLLLSRDRAYAVRNAATVALLTTTRRGIPVEVPLTPDADRVPRDCVVNADVIQTVPKAALMNRICSLSDDRMAEVDAAIRFALDLR
jgi:mRNA-degrading endonuclease toxin of MazEF toxin-antitoxin module